MRLFHLIILSLVGIASMLAQRPLSADDLEALDHELSLSINYDSVRYNRIKSLRRLATSQANDSASLANTYLSIGNEFEVFCTDSAMHYFNMAIDVAKLQSDSSVTVESKLGLVRTLGIQGLFQDGLVILEEVENNSVPDQLQEKWYGTGRQFYSYMWSQFFHDNEGYAQKYYDKFCYYLEKELSVMTKNSHNYNLFSAESMISKGERVKAKQVLLSIIADVPQSSNIYARAAGNLADIYEHERQNDIAAYYLCLSAISDAKAAVKENTSLQRLAIYLSGKGDEERAYRYLATALTDAVFCNSSLRTAAIARQMPAIDAAYKKHLDNRSKALIALNVLSIVLAICLVFAMFSYIKQIRKLRDARQKLKESNNIKEEYIGRFLELCSIYMDRLDNFCTTVVRKIKAGQTDDLLKLTKSSKFADEQHKLFYENFDSAFLHIYPNFIEEFNALLLPDQQIEMKEPGRLTTELRIFAFLRMGVDDSTKIANFLHYSVNTIYAYRNKMKNRARDRENLEHDVMKIGKVS